MHGTQKSYQNLKKTRTRSRFAPPVGLGPPVTQKKKVERHDAKNASPEFPYNAGVRRKRHHATPATSLAPEMCAPRARRRKSIRPRVSPVATREWRQERGKGRTCGVHLRPACIKNGKRFLLYRILAIDIKLRRDFHSKMKKKRAICACVTIFPQRKGCCTEDIKNAFCPFISIPLLYSEIVTPPIPAGPRPRNSNSDFFFFSFEPTFMGKPGGPPIM